MGLRTRYALVSLLVMAASLVVPAARAQQVELPLPTPRNPPEPVKPEPPAPPRPPPDAHYVFDAPVGPPPPTLLPRAGCCLDETAAPVSARDAEAKELADAIELALNAKEARTAIEDSPDAKAAIFGESFAAQGSGGVRSPDGKFAPPSRASQAPESAAIGQKDEDLLHSESPVAAVLRQERQFAALRSFADGTVAPALVARFEVRVPEQGPPEVVLVQPSASSTFDLWVLRLAKRLVKARSSGAPQRCVYEAAARAKYWSDMKELSALDAVGVAATGLVTGVGQGPMTDRKEPGQNRLGGFAATVNLDPALGRNQVVNLAHPHVAVTVQLVESDFSPRDAVRILSRPAPVP